MCIFLTQTVITEKFPNAEVDSPWLTFLLLVWAEAPDHSLVGEPWQLAVPVHCPCFKLPVSLGVPWRTNKLACTWLGKEVAG